MKYRNKEYKEMFSNKEAQTEIVKLARRIIRKYNL